LPVTAELVCADNTGAKILRIAQVTKYKGRHSRMPSAAVGDLVVSLLKGPAQLRKQMFGAVIIRQKYPIRRLSGLRLSFEDNAAVLVTPEGEIKGTDIKGPVAAEAAEKWPRIANLAPLIV
jgi:large subunit ribosomal protein L14